MINGKFAVPPELSDALDFHRADGFAQLRVELPGSIVSFDRAKSTASIRVLYNRTYPDGSVKVIKAPLLDVPVITTQGGGVHARFPIQPGDECVVVFCDINIDAWHANGGAQTPFDMQRHDIADGFATVGPNSLANQILTFLSATEGGIASAVAKVAIDKDSGLISISNESKSLAAILNNILLGIQGLRSTTPGNPVVDSTGLIAQSIADLAELLQ